MAKIYTMLLVALSVMSATASLKPDQMQKSLRPGTARFASKAQAGQLQKAELKMTCPHKKECELDPDRQNSGDPVICCTEGDQSWCLGKGQCLGYGTAEVCQPEKINGGPDLSNFEWARGLPKCSTKEAVTVVIGPIEVRDISKAPELLEALKAVKKGSLEEKNAKEYDVYVTQRNRVVNVDKLVGDYTPAGPYFLREVYPNKAAQDKHGEVSAALVTYKEFKGANADFKNPNRAVDIPPATVTEGKLIGDTEFLLAKQKEAEKAEEVAKLKLLPLLNKSEVCVQSLSDKRGKDPKCGSGLVCNCQQICRCGLEGDKMW